MPMVDFPLKIVGMCSLYEPLAFLQNRIRNLNQCDLLEATIFFADCSSEPTWKEVQKVITSDCKFRYRLHHFNTRTTLYYTWDWIIGQTLNDGVVYYCNSNVDDIQDPLYFRKMSQFLDQNPQAKIVACPWYVTKTKGQIWPPKYDLQTGPTVNTTMGHFPMWRADLHRVGIMFDERMLAVGDSYFWSAVRTKYGPSVFAIHPEILSCYLTHENNLYYAARGPRGESGEAWDRSIAGKR